LRFVDYRAVLQTSAGYYSNLLSGEIYRYHDAFINFTRALPPALNIVVFFVLVLALDWRVTVVGVLMSGMVFLLMRVSGRVARHSSAVTSAESQSLTGLLIQAIHSFKCLRATGTFPKFQERLDISTDRLAHAANRSGSAAALSQSLTQPVQVLFLTAILYWLNTDWSGWVRSEHEVAEAGKRRRS
jgi:subfamily B ATP-binding cassette protein MsbA